MGKEKCIIGGGTRRIRGPFPSSALILKLVWVGGMHGSMGLREVQSMVIICTKTSVTLGAFPLPRLISCPYAVETEYMEALVQDSILPLHFTGWASEEFLVFTDLLQHHFIRTPSHFNLIQLFHSPLQHCNFLLEPSCLERFSLQSTRLLRHCLLSFLHLRMILFCNIQSSKSSSYKLSSSSNWQGFPINTKYVGVKPLPRCNFRSAADWALSMAFLLLSSHDCIRMIPSLSVWARLASKIRSFSSNLRTTWFCASTCFERDFIWKSSKWQHLELSNQWSVRLTTCGV